uniref:Uncharacterized protein LOC100368107 n=1 Tax=Saccoglossus kowalevskii TaxID=10224 RepID=A0ABM0GJ52_SACKO|nr:PREDICTED: uncharacterized protein LOC100368107 [Saccoglossus kowalevskii]
MMERINTSPKVIQDIDVQSSQLCSYDCKMNKVDILVNRDSNADQLEHQGAGGRQPGGPASRKFFIDCGGNVASSVVLFRETYPDAEDFYIYSFELDARLCPYFAGYTNHTLYCPVAVSNVTGELTAYAEAAWYPGKYVNGEDKQWGGGSLFVSKNESTRQDGGERMLSYREKIPAIDLSLWLQEHFNQEDYVILKLDVEGAEYQILRKMLTDGTIHLVDKLYGEYHNDQPTGNSDRERLQIKADLKAKGYHMLRWIGERKTYHDFEFLHPPKVLDPKIAPMAGGPIISKCGQTGHDRNQVAIVISIGMGQKMARRVVAALKAHTKNIPCTLFVYGDFVEQFPEQVKDWSNYCNIGIRGHGPHLDTVWRNLNYYYSRMSVVSAVLRLKRIGIEPIYLFPPALTNHTVTIAKKYGIWLVQPNVQFPPRTEPMLSEESYYNFRDVERVPKALRIIHERLSRDQGGIISLDTDVFDSYMISVFLFDYLFENSGFNLVDLKQCYD